MSKQASANVVSFNTSIRPPRAGGLCAQAWELFAAVAQKQGSPCLSNQLPALSEKHGLNLTNLRIELSRFNRFMAQLAK